MTIEHIIQKIKDNKIKWRGHASKRIIEREIERDDVIASILHGEIIEEYPEDFPYPSFLILGYMKDGIPLHTVCAIGQDILWIITVYIPDLKKWKPTYKKRKSKEEK
ncbi:MAG: DUF4258 domain-containing protein [Candidatus Hodarchaeota archaeon]